MTFIRSPFHQPAASAPMSDAFADDGQAASAAAETPANQTPAAPANRLAVRKSRLPIAWLPTGAIMRRNLFAELAFFLVLWAAYGFVMRYVSEPLQSLVRLAFSPWAMAVSLLVTGWTIARWLASLSLRCTDLQKMAYATKDSTDTYDHADTEELVLDLLYGAKESVAKRSRWMTTLFCAIASYLIVSLLY